MGDAHEGVEKKGKKEGEEQRRMRRFHSPGEEKKRLLVGAKVKNPMLWAVFYYIAFRGA